MGEKLNKLLNLIPEFEKHKSRIKFNKDEQKDPSKSGNWDTAGLSCWTTKAHRKLEFETF